MKCPLCGYEFKKSESESACKGCPLAMSCSLVRCPNCGYETPVEPKLIKILKKWKSNASESE